MRRHKENKLFDKVLKIMVTFMVMSLLVGKAVISLTPDPEPQKKENNIVKELENIEDKRQKLAEKVSDKELKEFNLIIENRGGEDKLYRLGE